MRARTLAFLLEVPELAGQALPLRHARRLPAELGYTRIVRKGHNMENMSKYEQFIFERIVDAAIARRKWRERDKQAAYFDNEHARAVLEFADVIAQARIDAEGEAGAMAKEVRTCRMEVVEL